MLDNKVFKRLIAAVLIFVFTLVVPMQHMPGTLAASKAAEYIKEVRLFTTSKYPQRPAGATDDSWKDQPVIDWCMNQPDIWFYVPGCLNDGSGATIRAFKDQKLTWLVYQTTTDPDEAITDLAVMNERGNYDEAAYEQVLQQQKDVYKDLVKDMGTMLKEYRTNYQNKVPSAVHAHDMMNMFKDDDSGKLLGDLLLDINDDDLVSILLQANGKVVLAMQQQLALAADPAKTNWLERMEKLGSFDKLREQAIKACGGNAGQADAVLDKKYKESAVKLLDNWDDLKSHIDHTKGFIDKYGLSGKTPAEVEKWTKEHINEKDVFVSDQEYSIVISLGAFKYDGETLLNFFAKDKSDFEGDNLKKLYPVIACMTPAQLASINEYVSIFTLLQQTLAASIVDNSDKGKLAEIEKDKEDLTKKDLTEVGDQAEKMVSVLKNEEPASIYEGIDREIYKGKGGVAVTSTAFDYSKGAEKKWSDVFVDQGKYSEVTKALTLGFLVSGALAFTAGCVYKVALKKTANKIIDAARQGVANDKGIFLSQDTLKYISNFDQLTEQTARQADDVIIGSTEEVMKESITNLKKEVDDAADDALREILEKAGGTTQMKVLHGIYVGLTVFTVLLAVADIALTVTTLINYYNRDHLPVPKRMVDLSYSENKETTYTYYKLVQDQDGKDGDLLGEGGKQWLALYATHDAWAGDPILAPVNGDDYSFKVQTGSSTAPNGYSPLHMFGTTNVAQNITYADGESGYAYNDNNNGTYLFFKRGAAGAKVEVKDETEEATKSTDEKKDETAPATEEAEAVSGSAVTTEQTGTAISGGTIALIAAAGLVAGCFIGAVGIGASRKRKRIGRDDD